jgi:hypothetical protein
MRKLFYCGLEPYQQRYTLQLTEWNRRVFERRGLDVVYVNGNAINSSQAISVGQVLDAHGRSYYSMSQMMELIKLMQEGQVTGEDVIFFEDMFTPGFESLGYVLNQIPKEARPRIFVRCLAQTIDPDDFVHVWGMSRWMRYYEHMVNDIVGLSGGAVLASNEEMVAHAAVAGWQVPIYNISGLAFGRDEVLERVREVLPWDRRARRVVFASRWDQEKQPGFFMDLIEMWHQRGPVGVEFALVQGGALRSNDPQLVQRARQLSERGLLTIHENLSKNQYYDILNQSRLLINTALQDWTSNVISEADTLGCNVLFPAYRSFPEILANDPLRMYVPWSLEDVWAKAQNLLREPHPAQGKISAWTNGAIDRTVDIVTGQGQQWLRTGVDYRNHVSATKYQ